MLRTTAHKLFNGTQLLGIAFRRAYITLHRISPSDDYRVDKPIAAKQAPEAV